MEVVSDSIDVEYQLEQDDVRSIFENFGKVENVTVEDDATRAVVVMDDLKEGCKAQELLNFYKLTDTGTYLTVKWQFCDFDSLQKSALMLRESSKKLELVLDEAENETTPKAKQENFNASFENEVANCLNESNDSKINEDAPVTPEKVKKGVNTQCTSMSKFTCKYEIPIKNMTGYSVGRKIIGYRGKNMKNILDRLKNKFFNGPIQDMIKLRLRGQGSGFKEGPNNCESNEPLHLCVSSQYHDKYIEACKLVEKLLKDTYREYNNFCRYRGKSTKHYKIIKMENSPACFLSNYSE